MTAPSTSTPVRWTFVALGALSGAVALVPWPLWWSNLLAYHGEPATRWRIFLGFSALALLVAGILSRRLKDAPILGGTPETGLRSAFPLCCALVLLVAAALPRFYWPADWVKLGAPDHVEYALGAHNLLERGTYAIELNGTLHPPRYPYGYSTFFVAPVLAATGSEPRHAVYAGMISGVLVVLLLAAMGGRGFGAVTATGSVFLLLLYPLFLKYTHEVFADVAVTALFLGVFTLALCLRPSPTRWLAVGLFIAVAASVKFSLVLSAVFPWLVVRLPVTKDDSSENLSGGRPWTTTRRQLLLDLCLASGIGIGLVPLLIYNTYTFGEPLRTGYHYWCSLPYDFPALVFSPRYLWQSVDGMGIGNVFYYLLPGGEMAEKTPYCVLQVGYWLLVLAGLILGWNAPGSTRRAVRLMAVGASLQLAFFSFYFFRNTRLLLPVYVLLLPAAVYALVRLIRVPLELERSRVVGMCFAAWLAAGFWFLGPHYRGFENNRPGYRNTLTEAADRLVPDDALIISDLDGAYVTHYLLKGTERNYLPLDRGVEYASKYAQPRRPPPGARPTDDPFDHRALPADEWNAVEVYPLTALGNPDEIVRRLRKGQPCYAVLEDPRASRKLRSIGDRVLFEQVEPGVSVFRARYSPPPAGP